MMNVDQVLQTAYLRAAYSELREEERLIQRNREFYNGGQGTRLTARQQEYLGDIAGDIDDQALCNICRRAVEIPLERLAVNKVVAGEIDAGTLSDRAQVWWTSSQLNAWQYDIYEAALRDGQSCLIVGWDGRMPTFTLNTLYDGIEGGVRLHYSGDDGSLLYASKRYKTWDPRKLVQTGKTRLTLYFSDRIERYEDDSNAVNGWRWITEEEAGAPNPQPWVDAQGQPLGIPVVTFDNPGGSELDDVLMPQKALNKALADLMSAQDMHGFPLLYLKGYKAAIGADGKAASIKLAPGEGITLPADGEVGRVPGADIAPMFETGVMGWLQLCTIIKGWPMYLWARGEPPSGESLKVMESSLVSQVRRKSDSFGDSWIEAINLGARLHRLFTGEQLSGSVALEWADPQTHNEQAQMETLKTKWESAQIPLEQRWREAGYTEEQIAAMRMSEMNAAVDAARQSVLSAMLAQKTIGATPEQLMGGNA